MKLRLINLHQHQHSYSYIKPTLTLFCVLFLLGTNIANSTIDSLQVLLSKSTNKKEIGQLHIELSKAYSKFSLGDAFTHATQAHNIAVEINDKSLDIIAEYELASYYKNNGEFDKGIKHLKDAIKTAKTLNNIKYQCDAYALMGYMFRRKGESDLSFQKYQTCFKLSEDISYEIGIAQAEKGFGDLTERQGKYEQALGHYRKALKLAQKHNEKTLEVNILNATGIIYDYQGDLQKGLDYYIRAMQLAENQNDLVKASNICTNIASVHYYLENNTKALEYYLKSIDLSKKTNNRSGEADGYQGASTLFLRLKDSKKAREYALNDLELRKSMDDKRGLSFAYKNLGGIDRNESNFIAAEKNYKLGLKYAEETDQQLKMAVLNLQLGRLMNQTNKPQKAIKYLNKTAEISKRINVNRELSMAYEDLATSFEKLNQMDRAFKHQKLYSSIMNQILSKEIESETVKMQAVYEAKARDIKIENLENEATLRKLVLKRSQQMKNLLLAGGALLLILIGLLYNRFLLKKKTNNLLISKNTEIYNQSLLLKESLSEKETLLKEIHHRVKNNLQIISSLLSLQSKKITDKSVLASITEGKNRVEAMSLIHQNLYQSNNIASLDMQKYIVQFMQSISNSFGFPSRNLEYEINAHNINLDIDTAIPIGLIINEIVTNSVKHAFNGMEEGLIQINLSDLGDNLFSLVVKDNGIGLPKDFVISKSSSLGLRLINTLGVKQLKGTLDIDSTDGTQVSLKFESTPL